MSRGKIAVSAALLLALAACGYGQRQAAGRQDELPPAASASFLPDGETIEVVVSDTVPLDAAELIEPDGTPLPAARIERQAIGAEAPGLRPQIGVVASGGPVSGVDAGVGISLPIFGSGRRHPAPIASRAEFQVPDMERYRATWGLWEIRLRIGKALQGARYLTLPAPAPPTP